jgi:hypothetical protein
MASKKAKNKPEKHPALDFPAEWRFMKQHRGAGFEQVVRFSDERLPFFNSRPGAEQQRLREKSDVPFEL